MPYKHDMSNESSNVMLPKGWRDFEITGCTEETSKSSGNPMFVFVLTDLELQEAVKVYAVAVEGKRWFLKQILQACNILVDENGVMDWDIPDLLGKKIKGYVEHVMEKWINKDNKEVDSEKWKISKFVNSDLQGIVDKAEKDQDTDKVPF